MVKLKQLIVERIETYDFNQSQEKVDWNDGRIESLNIEYTFNTENYEYGVNAQAGPRDRYIEVKFGIPGKNMKDITNEGNVLKIINTAMDIIKKIGMNWGQHYRGFKFHPAKKSQDKKGLETSRGRIFTKYFKKTFPHSEIETKGNTIYINIGP